MTTTQFSAKLFLLALLCFGQSNLLVLAQQKQVPINNNATVDDVLIPYFRQIEPQSYIGYYRLMDPLNNIFTETREEFGISPYSIEWTSAQEWRSFLEPRLYPSGKLVDASATIWAEISRLQNAQNNATHRQMSNCNVVAQWANVGPFAKKTGDAAINTNAAQSTTLHQSPSPGMGRINFIKKHPVTNALYIGASNGGVWKSTDSGQTWQVLNDKIAVLGCSDMAIDSANNIMYLATGDRSRGGINAIGTTSYSMGVLKSVDGGLTWNPLADTVRWTMLNGDLTQAAYLKINALQLNNANELLIGTTDSPLTAAGNFESGVWKWNPTIKTWQQKQGTTLYNQNQQQTVEDAVVDLSIHPNNIVCVATQYGYLYRSTDGGNHFTAINPPSSPSPPPIPTFLTITNNSPTNIGRVKLATYKANKNILYALFVNNVGLFNKLLKSVDAGLTFKEVNAGTASVTELFFTAGKEHLALTVSPTDANTVYLGSNNELFKLVVTNNAGNLSATSTKITKISRPFATLSDTAYVHPDVKDFEWVGNTLYAATDGGVSSSPDGGATWSTWYDLTKDLCIAECYRMGAVPNSNNAFFTGTHDNGIWSYDGANSTAKWLNIEAGDCGEIAVVSADSLYANYFTGHKIKRGKKTGGYWTFNNAVVPMVANQAGGDRFPNGSQAILVQLHDTLFTTSQRLFRSTNKGATWQALPSAIPNTVVSGDTLYNVSFMNVLTTAPNNSKIMYVSKRRYQYSDTYPTAPLINRSNDGGNTWLPVYSRTDTIYGTNTAFTPDKMLPNLHLNRIAVHPTNPDKLWAVFSGYQKNQKVYQSIDGGRSWTNITGGGLPNLPVNALVVFEKDGLLQLVVGTDVGVYYTNETLISCSGGIQWQDFMQGAAAGHDFPNVIVQELEIHGTGNNRLLRAATFGRGIWETPLPAISNCSCAACGDAGYPLYANFTVFPEPAIGDNQFEVNTNWQQWLTELSTIQFRDASTGIIPTNGYNWTFENSGLDLNCNGDILTNEPCASVYWNTSGNFDATLTVTDITGCTNTITQTLNIHPYSSNCTINTTPATTLVHPLVTCSLLNSPCAANNANGIIYIQPIPTQYASGAYTYDITADNNPAFYANNQDLVAEPDGRLSLHCLAADTYTILITDDVSGCSTTKKVVLNQPITQNIVVQTTATTNSHVSCNGSTDYCDGYFEIFNLPTYYTYVWSGTSCDTCHSAANHQLYAGPHTVTITDPVTGCSKVLGFTIGSSSNIGNGSGGLAGSVDINVNPVVFDNTTNVGLLLPEGAEVTIEVFDVNGIKRATLLNNEFRPAGTYSIPHNATGQPDGVYIYVASVCQTIKGKIGIKQ